MITAVIDDIAVAAAIRIPRIARAAHTAVPPAVDVRGTQFALLAVPGVTARTAAPVDGGADDTVKGRVAATVGEVGAFQRAVGKHTRVADVACAAVACGVVLLGAVCAAYTVPRAITKTFASRGRVVHRDRPSRAVFGDVTLPVPAAGGPRIAIGAARATRLRRVCAAVAHARAFLAVNSAVLFRVGAVLHHARILAGRE